MSGLLNSNINENENDDDDDHHHHDHDDEGQHSANDEDCFGSSFSYGSVSAEEAECSGLLSERLLQRTREAAAPLIGAAALALGGDDGQDVGQEPPS